MKSLDELFDCWDSVADMASSVGVSHWRALKWRQRGRIPQQHWPTIVAEANRKGNDISADDLLVMHTRRRTGGSARASR